MEFKGAKAFLMIPVGIARDNDLLNKPKSIILMGEILSMLNVTGEFFMSNTELAKRLHVTPRSVKDYLILLEKKGLIKRANVYADQEQKVVMGRKITAGDTLGKYISLGWGSSLPQGREADFTRVGKHTSPKYNNVIEHKNRTNNINKGPAKKAEPEEIPYKEIIDYLNSKTKAHYKASSKVNQRLIKARIKDGYTPEDFKTVINNKAFEWQHTDMWKYMRPSTLFGSHFDDYLNENKLQKSVGTIYRNNQGKRVEKGTDWSKKKIDTQSGISTENLKSLFENLDENLDSGRSISGDIKNE